MNGARGCETGRRCDGAVFGEQAEDQFLALWHGQDVANARAHQAGDAGKRAELDEFLPHVLHDRVAGAHVDAGDPEQLLQREHTLAQRPLGLAEDDGLVGHELNDTTIRIEPGADIRQPAEDVLGAEPRSQGVDMFQPVEDRQNHRARADGRGKLAHRVVERIGLHANEHDVERLLELIRQEDLRLHGEVAMRAHDPAIHPAAIAPPVADRTRNVTSAPARTRQAP